MKTKELFAYTVLLIFMVSKISLSQVIIKTTKGSEPFEIPEIGALVIESEKGMEVVAVMPKENRPEAYRNVNLERGDKLLMVSGKKVTKAKECREIYEKISVGNELKLGVSRNEEIFLVSIKKADPKDLPKIKRMIIKKDGKSTGPDDKTPGIQEKRIIKTR